MATNDICQYLDVFPTHPFHCGNIRYSRLYLTIMWTSSSLPCSIVRQVVVPIHQFYYIVTSESVASPQEERRANVNSTHHLYTIYGILRRTQDKFARNTSEGSKVEGKWTESCADRRPFAGFWQTSHVWTAGENVNISWNWTRSSTTGASGMRL